MDSPASLAIYENMLRPYAFTLTKSKEETDDLVQDTLYRALVNMDKFSDGTNIKGWLYTIMRNIFINNYRRQKRFLTVTNTKANGEVLMNSHTVVTNESDKKFLAESISRAMQQVNKDFTEPFMMYYQGFHYQEISEKLDLPLGTVKSRIFAARKELQAKLKGLGVVNSAHAV